MLALFAAAVYSSLRAYDAARFVFLLNLLPLMKLVTKHFPFFLLTLAGFWAAGCAHSYDALNADQLAYQNTQESEGVTFSYRYDALRAAGNRQYAKEADEEGLSVVAVEVTNNTDEPLTLSRSTLQVTAGGAPVSFAETAPVVAELKQRVWP